MNQSQEIGKLSDALAKAQSELKNPHFDSTNPHFKSKFASLGAVREAVVPVFSRHNIAVTQWPLSSDGAAGCRTVVSHGGEWMAQDFLIPVDKQNAHGYASAVTYAKRISLQSIACVVGDVDDDGNEAVGDNVKGERQENGMGKGPKIPATVGAWEAMDTDMQTFLEDIASNARTLLKRDKALDAWQEIESHALTQDALLALWTRLDSKERSALKKIGPFTPQFAPEEHKPIERKAA